MARRFWEKVSNQKIQFYDNPSEEDRDDIDAEIIDLQAILALPTSQKAIIAETLPGGLTEEQFDQVYEDRINLLADVRDWMDNEVVTQAENIDSVLHRWMTPADMALGPGVVTSFCGEEVGNEAVGAIDGVGGNSWQHDVDEVHVIVFDLGYKKRIDAIRVKNTAAPGGPLQLSNVDVDVAGTVAKLDDAESRVGTALEFTGPNDQDQVLTIRNGRYVRVTIGSTGHASNHITVRDFEVRVVPRTKGL